MTKKRISPFVKLTKKSKVAELVRILRRYDELSSNQEFAKDCRTYDRLDTSTPVGDRRTSEAAVAFYLFWKVYPIPDWLLNDHNFRVWLEQFFLRRQRVIYIPVSPLTTQAEVVDDFRRIKRDIGASRKLPKLKRLRVTLLYHHLILCSAFHAFKASDFAMALGSKPTKGKAPLKKPLKEKELEHADHIVSELVKQGFPYPRADRQAMRRTVKQRWREAKPTPKIRMATRRAMRNLKALVSDPNI